jgi:hypothetical protein
VAERRPSNSELRLRQLTAEEGDSSAPRGIFELFEDEQPEDVDAPLAREGDDEQQ